MGLKVRKTNHDSGMPKPYTYIDTNLVIYVALSKYTLCWFDPFEAEAH